MGTHANLTLYWTPAQIIMVFLHILAVYNNEVIFQRDFYKMLKMLNKRQSSATRKILDGKII